MTTGTFVSLIWRAINEGEQYCPRWPSLLTVSQWRIQGANPAMAPHRSCQWSLAPLGGRNSNGRIVNVCKFKDFGPCLIDVGYGFGPPTENQHIKTRK